MNINLYAWLSIVLLCPLGCSESASTPASGLSPGPSVDGGSTPSANADGAPANGIAMAGPGAGGATASYATPGQYQLQGSATGSNACAGVTLDDILADIRAATPALANVTMIYRPSAQSLGDGNFIYPYQRADGGFDIAFKRGAGDCPAGCTDNTYDYFQTDDHCAPIPVGHYHAVSGACLQVDGAPMWGHPPPPPDLSMVCGADNTPQLITGTYSFRAQGQWQPCATAWDRAMSNTLDAVVTVVVTQKANDPATGTVVVTGTGLPTIDGVVLQATFLRRRFEATMKKSNLTSNCLQENAVAVRYDFESGSPGTLTMSQTGDANCSGCKGSLAASLVPASVLVGDR